MKVVLAFLSCLLWLTSFGQINREDNIVGATFSIQSAIMDDEREVQVFLPDSYATSDMPYPVLYVLDGQRYFLHAVSLQKSFVEFKQSPEFIVVGISKVRSDRNRNLSVQSQEYLDFIREEVIHLVDTEYRTSDNRLLFGWAYGGGFVIETMIQQPDLFDAYIAASPFPLTERINQLDSILTDNPSFDRQLFFTSDATEGVVTEGTHGLHLLLTDKAPVTMDWTFKALSGEEHRSTPFTTLYHGIRHYFQYYPELQFSNLEEYSKTGGLPYVYDYHQKRATQYGFSNELSDWTMFSLTRNAIRANDYQAFDAFINEFETTGFLERLRASRSCLIAQFYLENKQHHKAIDLFALIAKKNPKVERPLVGLGDTYVALNMEEEASKYYAKAKKLSKSNADD